MAWVGMEKALVAPAEAVEMAAPAQAKKSTSPKTLDELFGAIEQEQ